MDRQFFTYTPNAVESFNSQLPKVTKTKLIFPTSDGLLKMLYLPMMDISKKGTRWRQEWNIILAQLAIYFTSRMPEQYCRNRCQGKSE